MTSTKATRWTKGEFPRKTRISDQDKQAMADYLRAGLNMGKPRDGLLEELAEKYHRSTRQIERYIGQRSQSEQEPYEETSHKRKAEEILHTDDPLKKHFAELSETALTLAANFESFLDMGDGIIFDSTVGNIIYGGWLEPTEYWDYLRDRYRVKMRNIPMFLALDLLSHLRDDFPDLANINDWAELTSNELTYDLVARLTRTAKKGSYRGKCKDCPS